MKINLDAIQSPLDLYQSAMDNKIPVADEFQEHFRRNRRQLLDGFKKAAGAQLLILGALTPENETERAQLVEARRIVKEFEDWAETELGKLDS